MKKKHIRHLKLKKINSLCSVYDFIHSFEKKFVFFMLFALLFGVFNKSIFSEETNTKENIPVESTSAKTEITTINIKNARQTSYKKSEETGNDLIILEGSVELSVQKGESTSEILADNITYDRKTEMLYAEGNVQITTKSSSSGEEKTSASSLLLNTSTLEGIFDDGKVTQTQTDALNLPSGSTLIVFSDLFGKGSEKTIAFKNSTLTFCDDENPHWKITATRTWLLPGGEFAFFNALLYVGSIPVLYLPVFYYPKDELIFNPVFSTRKREGYSIQTTTYVCGRKPLDTSSTSSTSEDESSSAEALKGLYNFVRPTTLKEQKLEGLVLHNLDNDFTGDSSQYVKIIADWYTNLGGMVGFDANFTPKNEWISKIAFNLDAGFSRTIFKSENSYFPFDSSGKKYWDKSAFMGWEVPFRYSGKLEFSLAKPLSLSVSLPVYSDPYYGYDFKTYRSEYMDWISYFLDSSKIDSEEITISEVSSFNWQINASFSPKLPDLFKPYISSLSISLKSSVNFSSKSAIFSETVNGEKVYYYDKEKYSDLWTTYTPERRFYYPSLVTPANISFSMSGTIFSWPLPQKNKTSQKLSFPITLNKPDELKTQKEIEKDKKQKEEQTETDKDNKTEKEKTDEKKEEEKSIKDFEFFLPDLAYTPTVPKIVDGINYKLTYSAAANYSSQVSYSSSHLKQSDDFEWKDARSFMYTLKTPLSLKSDFNYGGNFVSVSNSISYSPVWQEHPFISDDKKIGGYSENEIKNMHRADNNAKSQDIINVNTVSIKPFVYFDAFSDSGISWNSNIKLFRRDFSVENDEEKWENFTADWDDEKSVTVNSLSAVFSAKEFNKKVGQTLTFTTVMRPLLKQYSTTLGLTFPYVTASVGTGLQEKTKDSNVPQKEKWKKNPISQSLAVTFPLFSKNITFSQSYSYNQDEEHHDSFKLSVSWNGISVSYLSSYVTGYDFDKAKGWIARSEKEFLPYSLTFSYVPPSKTFYRWFNRISVAPNINTSIVYDFLRPTNSYFIFSPSITFKLHKFLDLTFSSTSRNSVLYWYFHNEPGDFYNEGGVFPFNMFVDLFNSFRFDSNKLRENSGFKLKSLNMTLSHDLHDWKLNMSLKIEPRVITENGRKYYDFSPYFTIAVIWNPMDSIKTTVTDKYGEWKLE